MCFLRSPLRFVRPPLSFPPIHTRLPAPRQPLHPLHVHVREYASRLGLTSRVSSTIFNSTKRFDRVIPWWPEAESLFFHLLRCRVQLPRTASSTIVIQRTTDVSRRVSHRTMPRRLCSLILSLLFVLPRATVSTRRAFADVLFLFPRQGKETLWECCRY